MPTTPALTCRRRAPVTRCGSSCVSLILVTFLFHCGGISISRPTDSHLYPVISLPLNATACNLYSRGTRKPATPDAALDPASCLTEDRDTKRRLVERQDHLVIEVAPPGVGWRIA